MDWSAHSHRVGGKNQGSWCVRPLAVGGSGSGHEQWSMLWLFDRHCCVPWSALAGLVVFRKPWNEWFESVSQSLKNLRVWVLQFIVLLQPRPQTLPADQQHNGIVWKSEAKKKYGLAEFAVRLKKPLAGQLWTNLAAVLWLRLLIKLWCAVVCN